MTLKVDSRSPVNQEMFPVSLFSVFSVLDPCTNMIRIHHWSVFVTQVLLSLKYFIGDVAVKWLVWWCFEVADMTSYVICVCIFGLTSWTLTDAGWRLNTAVLFMGGEEVKAIRNQLQWPQSGNLWDGLLQKFPTMLRLSRSSPTSFGHALSLQSWMSHQRVDRQVLKDFVFGSQVGIEGGSIVCCFQITILLAEIQFQNGVILIWLWKMTIH